jgi:hypothetical protein
MKQFAPLTLKQAAALIGLCILLQLPFMTLLFLHVFHGLFTQNLIAVAGTLSMVIGVTTAIIIARRFIATPL